MPSSDLTATTTVRIELRDRKATIEDVQQALDTLTREGIPSTFEVKIQQSDDRAYEKDVAWENRIPNHRLVVEAERSAVTR